MRQEIVGKEELRKAKECLKGRLVLELEHSPGLASFLGHQELLLGKIIMAEEQMEEIEKVTSDDIIRVAEKIFINNCLNLAVVGPFTDIEKFRELVRIQI